MQNIKISFIVPVYNLEQLLPRCLQSLLVQTLKNIEIIVVDDGSSDGSHEIINNYVALDSRFRGFFLEHQGVSGVRNFGISQARGKYIGFVDGDDFLATDFAEKMNHNIEQENGILCCCGVVKIHSQEQRQELFLPRIEAVVHDFFHQNPNIRNPVWNKLYQTELVKKWGISFPPRALFAEDYAFTTLYYLLNNHAGGISYVAKPLYNYWRHDSSIMSNLHHDLGGQIHEIMANIAHIDQVLLAHNQHLLFESDCYRQVVINYFLITLPLLLIHNSLIRYKISHQEVQRALSVYNSYQQQYREKVSLRSRLVRLKFKVIISLTRIYAPVLHWFK